MDKRIEFYKSVLRKGNNDHITAIEMGSYLSRLHQISRNSEEELLVAYYEKYTKKIESEVSTKQASMVLMKVEDSYVRDYGCELEEFQGLA